MSSPFAAPYARPTPGTLAPPPSRPQRGAALGVIALVVAAVAVPAAGVVAAVTGFRIGLGAGKEIAARPAGAPFDLAVLTPVRYDVLIGEIAFWAGTVLGVWALIQGIVAIVSARGRAPGVAAVIVAAVGPAVFFVLLGVMLQAGLGAGTGIGG